jgi:hypothetical protein
VQAAGGGGGALGSVLELAAGDGFAAPAGGWGSGPRSWYT